MTRGLGFTGELGLFGSLLGGDLASPFGYPLGMVQFPQQGYDFQFMAAQRMGHGLEPIDWPTLLVNLFRAEALTRPLTIGEKLLYDGAVQAVKNAKERRD